MKLKSLLPLFSAAMLAAGSAKAQPEALQSLLKKLDGSIWCAQSTHTRLDVDMYGKVATKEGKNICLNFTRQNDQLVTKTTWWNVSKGMHIVEWAITIPVTNTMLQYTETDQPSDSDFPGIAGSGTLTMRGKFMDMTQLGHLLDGSVAGFSTRLVQVKEMPVIPVPQTYPPK